MTDPIPVLTESVPVTPTPAAPVVTETPEAAVETPVEPSTPEPTLYDLPDGRKVDAETLQKEWKDNFYPEYTRKSQRLAEYENINKPQENIPDWKRPDYVPQTYAEIIEKAKFEALDELRNQAIAEDNRAKEVASMVDTQISAIRSKDPKLDENALFSHANKYGFRDLGQAYENMRYIKQIELDTEARVLKNVTKRTDPVAGQGGPGGPTPMAPNAHQRYGSALEFLQRIKGN